MPPTRIAFAAADTEPAQEALARLIARYGNADPDRADVIVALGGDGLMLETLHAHLDRCPPIYGMNRGSVGFLMNDYVEAGLPERLAQAHPVILHPLRMITRDGAGNHAEALAVNEVSLLRSTRQAAKLTISIDGKARLPELICDGALVSTSAGSTAYNLSAHGPILPIEANVLALTPISAFRPRRWRGAILPHTAEVRFDILEADKRPVNAVADYTEVVGARSVTVREDRGIALNILFDPEHNLSERILQEQFQP